MRQQFNAENRTPKHSTSWQLQCGYLLKRGRGIVYQLQSMNSSFMQMVHFLVDSPHIVKFLSVSNKFHTQDFGVMKIRNVNSALHFRIWSAYTDFCLFSFTRNTVEWSSMMNDIPQMNFHRLFSLLKTSQAIRIELHDKVYQTKNE